MKLELYIQRYLELFEGEENSLAERRRIALEIFNKGGVNLVQEFAFRFTETTGETIAYTTVYKHAKIEQATKDLPLDINHTVRRRIYESGDSDYYNHRILDEGASGEEIMREILEGKEKVERVKKCPHCGKELT